MRKLLLLLLLNLSIAAMALNTLSQDSDNSSTENNVAAISESHKPMLVEGRTWWYTQKHRLYNSPMRRFIAENGISVGEEVEIDGVKWHKINVISSGISRSEVWEYNKTPRLVAYMREEDNKLYTIYTDDCLQDIEAVNNYTGPYAYDRPQLTYAYLNTGESYVLGEEEFGYGSITITDISQINNSGFDYTLYTCKIEHDGENFSFIEGLGCIDIFFFFDPFSYYIAAEDKYDPPLLRYITDPDGTIIYEGIGGYKLWEATGVGNVIAEDDDSCRWYNLQGMEIDEPTSPGIYIRSSRKGNEKVAIR